MAQDGLEKECMSDSVYDLSCQVHACQMDDETPSSIPMPHISLANRSCSASCWLTSRNVPDKHSKVWLTISSLHIRDKWKRVLLCIFVWAQYLLFNTSAVQSWSTARIRLWFSKCKDPFNQSLCSPSACPRSQFKDLNVLLERVMHWSGFKTRI